VKEGRNEEAARFHDELLADVYAVQAHMRRLEAAASAFQREQDLYKQKQEQLHAAIAQTEQDISNRKLQLDEAREELGRQQEYEAVKERVVKVPARSATRAEMAAVEKEIADLDQQGAALEVSMARRKSQFASIMQLIEQVHQGLEQEGPEEGALVEEEAPEPMNVE
jgi:chromosome segregation ATPase